LGVDDWTDDGESDDEISVVTRPAAQSSIELWKELLNSCPDKQSFSVFDGGERVKMRNGQTLCVAGQYYIRVLSGAVILCRALLSSRSPVQRIVAPTTEAIPVIRCVVTGGAEIEISNVGRHEDFETLGIVSPLFLGMWGHWETEASARPKKTFQVV
jgi:hypothetical protein